MGACSSYIFGELVLQHSHNLRSGHEPHSQARCALTSMATAITIKGSQHSIKYLRTNTFLLAVALLSRV
jgi:hypothetical protein